MDKTQRERVNQSRDYHEFYKRPYNTRKSNFQGCKRGYYRGLALRGRDMPYSYQNGTNYNCSYNRNNFRKNCNTKIPSRSSSPVEGSEEFMTRKIQHTSAIIMRHLLSPTEEVPCLSLPNKEVQNVILENKKQAARHETEGSVHKSLSVSQNHSKKINSLNVKAKEIYDKIMTRIGNLTDGRKKNIINADCNSHWDQVLNHMQKQKRLEISRILRDMSSTSFPQDNTDNCLSSLEPDLGIKIEELPLDVIEELRLTLNIDLENLNEELAASSSAIGRTNNLSQMEIITDPVEIKDECEDDSPRKDSVDRSLKQVECDDSDGTVLKSDAAASIVNESIHIKEEPDNESTDSVSESLPNILSQNSTVVCSPKPINYSNDGDTTVEFNNSVLSKNDQITITSARDDNSSMQILKLLKSTIEESVTSDKLQENLEVVDIVEKTHILDMCIKELTNYRTYLTKSILNVSHRNSFNRTSQESCDSTSYAHNTTSVSGYCQTPESIGDKRVIKKRKLDNDEIKQQLSKTCELVETEPITENVIDFPQIKDKITSVQLIESELIAGTQGGDILFFSLKNGLILHTLDVTCSAITCIQFVRESSDLIYMFVGCMDGVLQVFNFRKRELSKMYVISDQIRCMDVLWNRVFMGCKNGTLIRYGCKRKRIEFEDKAGDEILVLKAAQEGPRSILIIGHRSAPICIRDALSGLILRKFDHAAITPTVYSLVVHRNFIYCGTSKDDVLVYAFHEGSLRKKIIVDKFKGISCMSINKNMLFIGCYNGSLYVYNLETNKLESTLCVRETGNSIVCMTVLSKQVVVGKIRGGIESIKLPENLFR